MKKFLLIMSAVVFCFLLACSSKESGKVSEKAKKNLEAFHAIVNAFMTGDNSKIDDFVAADYVDHSHVGGNRDSLKAMVTWMHKSARDMKMETIREIADDEYVCSWSHYTGISDGNGGMPNGPYDFSDLQIAKFKDGKAIEYWEFMEPSQMMKMTSGGTAPVDTTKKM